MARETGLEPAASAVTGRRSNQLSYSRNSIQHNSSRILRVTGPRYEFHPVKSRLQNKWATKQNCQRRPFPAHNKKGDPIEAAFQELVFAET